MVKSKKIVWTFISIVLPLFFNACGPTLKNPEIAKYPDSMTVHVPQQEYRINVGDQLDIKFFYNSELNEQVTVRPDGRISLQLAHEIMTDGLTPAELTDLLKEKYAKEIQKPEITVIVRSFSAQKVYMDGEVNNPGVIDLIRPMTILQAISQAGGLKDSARIDEIIIIRRTSDKKPMYVQVNLSKIINATDVHQNIPLLPYDIVYVPKSPIANVNLWIDQYIRKNIPIPFGFGYSLN